MSTENNKDRQGILPGIPAHVANYHPAWMNDLGKKSNPRLAALMQRLAQEQVAAGKSREEVPKATQSDVCPPAEISVDQSAALPCSVVSHAATAEEVTAIAVQQTAITVTNPDRTAKGASESPSSTGRRFDRATKLKALIYFRKGWGYKATAAFLGLGLYTVREWKRKYSAGQFLTDLTPAEQEEVLAEAPEIITPEERAAVKETAHGESKWAEID